MSVTLRSVPSSSGTIDVSTVLASRQPAPRVVLAAPIKGTKAAAGLVAGLLVLPFLFAGLCFAANKWPWEVGR